MRVGKIAAWPLALWAAASGCGDDGSGGRVKPDAVVLTLAPDVVSSAEGSLSATAVVLEGTSPQKNWSIRLQVVFTDQLGRLRTVPGVTADTDATGALRHTFEQLRWAGAGTITAEVLDSDGQPYIGKDDLPLATEATFAVIDLSPPTVTILPVTSDNHVGPSLPLDVQVDFGDEIGVSNVILQAVGELEATRTRIIASGSSSGSVVFDLDVPGGAIQGPNITLYALAEDLSGNITAAQPLTLIVDDSVLIAVPPGLAATNPVAGNGTFLDAPRSLAFSPKDSMLYVADNSGGACGGGCIWRVDPADGTETLVTQAAGVAEGLAFDATGDNLYFSDAQNRIVRLSFDAGSLTYTTPVRCHSLTAPPQDPRHLLVDGTTLYIAETNDQELKSLDITDCLDAADTTSPVSYSDTIDTPWGVSMIPGGDLLLSDAVDDVVYAVQANGTVTVWESARLDVPRGIEWLGAGGNPTYADALFVASNGDQRVYYSRGLNTARTAVSTRADPVDVAFGSGVYEGTLFVLTEPGPGAGRIFAVTGF